MTALLTTAIVVGVLWTLAYRGASLQLWTAAIAAILVGLWTFGAISTGGFILSAVIFTPIAVLLNRRSLRQSLITKRIFSVFRKVLPNMNDTERAALEAGDTWWESEMFQGRPQWDKLLDFQRTELTAEEQSFLDNEVEELCAMTDEWATSFERKDLAPEVWDYIRKKGFFGMLIGKEYGGLGFSAFAQSSVVTKISTRSGTAAVTVMVPNSLGPGELLTHYGTEAQKNYWLPRLAKGEEIPCFGLTGPEVGSDAGALPDVGVVCEGEWEGEKVLGMRLTFSKRYITLAPVSTVIGLAFKLQDPDGLLGDADKTDYGITCALIPSDLDGVDVGRRHLPVGSPFMNGPINATDLFVPLEFIIGGRDMAGQGWRMLVECLSAGRGISLPASATAAGLGAYGATGAYTRIRRQFNMSVGKFEGVQEATGRIAGLAYTLEACRTLTASAVDHCAPSVVTAMMKYHMTEMMRQVITDAMDVHGGRAVMQGPRNYLAGGYQSVPVAITVEGANIMTRNLIIFGQGAIRCHPYVFPEMEAARNPDFNQGLVEFDELLFKHMGFTINRAVRAFTLGLTGARLAKSPKTGPVANYYQQLERMSASLAFIADMAMSTLGGELKRKESMSARLGDVLSHLYMASAVLKFYHDQGEQATDWPHVQWSVERSLAAIGQAFSEFFRNFPNKILGRVMRTIVFPLGNPYPGPDDTLTQKIANLTMTRTPFHERAANFIYIGDENSNTGRMLKAVELLDEIDNFYQPFLKAISKGKISGSNLEEQLQNGIEQGMLDAAQAQQIREYDAMRYDAILTDAFSQEYVASSGREGKAPDNVVPLAVAS